MIGLIGLIGNHGLEVRAFADGLWRSKLGIGIGIDTKRDSGWNVRVHNVHSTAAALTLYTFPPQP